MIYPGGRRKNAHGRATPLRVKPLSELLGIGKIVAPAGSFLIPD